MDNLCRDAQAAANRCDWAGRCCGAGSALLDRFCGCFALCLHETVLGRSRTVIRRRGFLFFGVERRRLYANI